VLFWNGSFGDKKEVSAEEFGDKLAARFPTYPSDVVFKIVDHFIAMQSTLDKPDHLGVKQFVAFLEKFGPFAEIMNHVTSNFFDKAGNVHRWYHHSVDRENAKKRMKSPDTYLVRDSSHKNSFVLMYAKSGAGLKELLIEMKKGVFNVNPDQEHPEKFESMLKILESRVKDLEATTSTLYTAYYMETKVDDLPNPILGFAPPSDKPAATKYADYAAAKAVLKEKTEKSLKSYVPYFGGKAEVAADGSGAPAGNKYATYNPGDDGAAAAAAAAAGGEKSSLVSAALARAGATGGHSDAGGAAAPAGGSKYQTYDPSAGAATPAVHNNYQAYSGGS